MELRSADGGPSNDLYYVAVVLVHEEDRCMDDYVDDDYKDMQYRLYSYCILEYVIGLCTPVPFATSAFCHKADPNAKDPSSPNSKPGIPSLPLCLAHRPSHPISLPNSKLQVRPSLIYSPISPFHPLPISTQPTHTLYLLTTFSPSFQPADPHAKSIPHLNFAVHLPITSP